MKKFIIVILAGLLLAGCATIFSGSRQAVMFAAPGGTKIYKEGLKVAEVPAGDTEVVTVMDRSLSGAWFVAKKEGYHDARFFVKMKVNGVVFINIILGGVIGTAVDLATGAAAKYPDFIEIEMEPLDNSAGAIEIAPL